MRGFPDKPPAEKKSFLAGRKTPGPFFTKVKGGRGPKLAEGLGKET